MAGLPGQSPDRRVFRSVHRKITEASIVRTIVRKYALGTRHRLGMFPHEGSNAADKAMSRHQTDRQFREEMEERRRYDALLRAEVPDPFDDPAVRTRLGELIARAALKRASDDLGPGSQM